MIKPVWIAPVCNVLITCRGTCRYTALANAFKQTTGLDRAADGQSVSLSHQLNADHSLQDSLLYYAAEQDPQKYVESFDQLVAFVDASLDLYRVCMYTYAHVLGSATPTAAVISSM